MPTTAAKYRPTTAAKYRPTTVVHSVAISFIPQYPKKGLIAVAEKKYLKRVYDDILAWRMQTKGAVLVEGAKWCGKTSTAERIARSVLYMQNPQTRDQNRRLAQIAPQQLLAGPAPRLIDEWQEAPQLWDAVRFEVDQRNEFGQFILTSSATPPDMSQVEHSGTGRIGRIKMRPMSLMESLDSTGGVSLGSLLNGEEFPVCPCDDGLEELAYLMCRGGWPRAAELTDRVALQQAIDYVDAITEVDISRVDGVKRSPRLARLLLRSYARMSATQSSLAGMRSDLLEAGVEIGETAFLEYVEALRKLFVLEDLDAWNPNLRSKTAIRTTPTRHMTDPSIATVALGASPASLMADLNTMGLLFETLCVRDLRTYAEGLDGEMLHYRDKLGRECDAVVRLRDGRYGLIEIKLGGEDLIEEGAKSLKAVAAAIDTTKMPSPAFLMVLTGTGGFSYPREDGVMVVPIRALGI